jgi:hypothetical protein
MNNQATRDRIAEEAVGQKHDSAPPEGEKEELPDPRSAGAQASTSEKTAESVGERVPDAYSDAGDAARTWRPGSQAGSAANPILAAGRQLTETVSRQFDEQPFMVMGACFALGYITAVVVHGRSNTDFGSTPGSAQISHPRGFVESAALKTLAEHPQGMTTAEIAQELGRQGISPQSVVTALGALVQARKVSQEPSGGKYVSAAAEVPSAPDQPSS